jgi:hypothetical protein
MERQAYFFVSDKILAVGKDPALLQRGHTEWLALGCLRTSRRSPLHCVTSDEMQRSAEVPENKKKYTDNLAMLCVNVTTYEN